MNVMPCSRRRILLPLLSAFLLLLAGCSGGSGSQTKSPTTVVIGVSSISVTDGQQVTLAAYVNPGLATGTVTFYNGTHAIGTAAISSPEFSTVASAALTTTFSSAGTQSITAHYSGDDFYSASTSSAALISVSNAPMASSVTLAASTTTPLYQTSVTLTATVSPSTATGTVNFFNGGTIIGSATVSAGAASLTTSFAAGGTATLQAVYSGDDNYLSSTSNSLTISVSGPLATTTTLMASAPATAIGDSVTLTANLAPATATGTVTFYNGSTAIGTANVNAGVATLNTTFANSGNIVLKAAFAASASWEASTSMPVILFVSGDTPDTVVLQVAPSSIVIGYSTTLTATVSPAEATGSVAIYDGTNEIGGYTLTGEAYTFVQTFMSAGSHSLTAVYYGDTTYISSTSSPVILQVSNPGSTPTTTTLTLSEYTGNIGDTVTLSANVAPPEATGQVEYYDNGAWLATVPLSPPGAAWSQAFTQYNSNSITAVYDGDVTYAPSTSGAQDLELSNSSGPPPPTCPTDPILCQIECPADPTCPSVVSGALGAEKRRTSLTDPLKLK